MTGTTSDSRARPDVSTRQAEETLQEIYGLSGAVSPLPGERDRNFGVSLADGRRAVLKFSHPSEDPALLEERHRLLDRLGAGLTEYRFPTPIRTLEGPSMGTFGADPQLLVHLLTWVPGTPLAEARPRTPELMEGLGTMLGRVDGCLAGWKAESARRELRWDLRHGGTVVPTAIGHIAQAERRLQVERLLAGVLAGLKPLVPRLRTGLIHGDANDHNVLVAEVVGDPDAAAARSVTGLIDFGDVVDSWIVGDLAIACAYALLGTADPAGAARSVVRGYHEAFPLTEPEIAALPHLILLRLLVSVSLSAEAGVIEPANPYLRVSEGPAWRLIDWFEGHSSDLLHFLLREACSLEPCPRSRAVIGWLSGPDAEPRPVLTPDPAEVRAVVLDLSVSSLEVGSDLVERAPPAWSDTIFDRMREADAELVLGRYDEVRTWYRGPAYDLPAADGEGRTVHLGLDLFTAPGTAVMAPLDGTVHSVRDNDRALDYGPTLVLEHRLPDATSFFTVYGHLGPAVLDLEPGQDVRAGQRIAVVGDTPSNGGWPPHLHFQLVVHMLGHVGDFPGVAPPSQRRTWLSVSPDPNLLLRVPGLAPAPRSPEPGKLLETRHRVLGRNLSVAYERPLHIVRGSGQFLIDHEGRRYLDGVNNVAHVGHSHPRVVAAAAHQMAVLNTNTRYLHTARIEYAERLASTFPDPLSVCFLVCSGSEANELALRLARAHTGERDVVVVDGAYHGNTSSLVDMSPYKHRGPGGEGAPAWVHTVPMPDTYRGRYRAGSPNPGARYASDVAGEVSALKRAGAGPAAFFCESILSCAGQIVLPEGYLAAAVDAVRGAGGLYVADEVQVGFGRTGRHFWGFEEHGVVPDIVTLGKPIGNGHPIGAVVTTPAVAGSFDTGMEYFNTFGGNPVSCAIGSAVLDVIEEEHLQENAAKVGERFLHGLRALRRRWPVIGDVRGRGLFLGIELVLDAADRTPAPRHARYLVERLRHLGVLLSTDGPDRNVVKIKPPLVFTGADADRVLDTMDRVLAEDAFRLEG